MRTQLLVNQTDINTPRPMWWRFPREGAFDSSTAGTYVRAVRLLTPERIEWMVDNAPPEELSIMAKELLHQAAKACETRDWEGLAQLILEWEATIEELTLDGENLEEILRAREELKRGEGLSWEELRANLEL